MRPLNLRISAFGPYAGNVQIEMEHLGEKGLYLITGDTGAGKTTIFDAICFALFGEASGPGREPSMLRSKYALPDTPTEVELTFRHMGKVYTVKRNPEYMRPAKKGGGETRQLSEAQLSMPDGSVITKTRNVTAKVEEILGINKDQFSQIAMLAQGDFLKLLLASTEERIKIFRDLFKTQNYLTLQKALENSSKELYGKVQDGKKSIAQYINGIQALKDNVLSIEVEKAQKGELTIEDVIDLLDRLTSEDSASKQKLDEELTDIAKELADVNKRIGSAEAVQKAIKSREEAKALLEEAMMRTADIDDKYQKAKTALNDKSNLEKKIAMIEADYPKYDKAEALENEIDEIKKELNIQKDKTDRYMKEKSLKTDELAGLKKEQEAFRDNGAEIARLTADSEKIDVRVSDIEELFDVTHRYFDRVQDYNEKQKLFKDESDNFERLNDQYELMERSFRNAQAGILAQGLEEGMECPVCGATHHPRLATIMQDVPNEKELEGAKKKADKARTVLNNTAKDLSGDRNAIEMIEVDLKKKAKKLLDTDIIENVSESANKKMEELKASKARLKTRLKELEEHEKRRIKVDKLIPELDKEIGDMDLLISDLKAKISGEKAKLESGQNEISSLYADLNFVSKKDAQKENKRLSNIASSLQKEYDLADKQLKDHKNYITELETKVRENEKTIEQSNAADIDKEKECKKELEDRQNECIRQGKIVAGRLDNNERTRTNIIRQASDITKVEKKLQWVKALSDTANGKLAGKDKVMLETYIQTTYFDRIINRANLRLVTMSGGQYELIRLREAGNVKSQSGLDLGVIDHYNGSQRSVRTLSGGESFMASLSLALGLSDEVQSSAGGIQIDTLFVDEGFGSLDPEALDMAYRALAGLIEGNRLVGIISHVSDLKARIDRQIMVTKEKSGGSRVEIII